MIFHIKWTILLLPSEVEIQITFSKTQPCNTNANLPSSPELKFHDDVQNLELHLLSANKGN